MKTRTIQIDASMYNALRNAYDLTVGGNGYLGGKFEGWRVVDGMLVSPDGDHFHKSFLEFVAREFALRGQPMTRRRFIRHTDRQLRQTLHSVTFLSRPAE